MEEELLKRNTDCVYFLASPLTCKKGFGCEYRHSEIARLNPRDCWYWLAGNCLNPTCGFRHPPLEGHAQVSSESASLPYQFSAPVNKSHLPCYFYFYSFCNKGDRCSFQHGPDGSSIKYLKTDALPSDHKTSVETDGGAAITETHASPSKPAPDSCNDMASQLTEEIQQSAPGTMIQKSVSPERYEEAPFVKSSSLVLKEGITQSSSPMCTDESSEDIVDDSIEREERWESSPGFDVLVESKSEDMDSENGSEYPLAPDGEQREHFLTYDYEDTVQHETRYPNVKFQYDRDVYDAYEYSDNEYTFDELRNPPGRLIDRRLGSLHFQKRGLLPVEHSIDVDLRDYLVRGKVVDDNHFYSLSRRSKYSNLNSRSLRKLQRHSMGQKLRGKHSIELVGDQGCFRDGSNWHGWFKHLEPNCSIRQPYFEKRLPRRKSISSEYSRNLIARERKSTDASTAFAGPKSLAQIREERKKSESEEDGGKMRHISRTGSADFQGPKPLSEILKDKGRLDTTRNGHTSTQ